MQPSPDAAFSMDLKVLAADGSSYRVRSQPRGKPMRSLDGVDTAFGPLDFLIFVVSLSQRLVTALNMRFRKGWTIGVLKETNLGWRVIHREHLDDGKVVPARVQELVRAIETNSRIA